MNQFSQILQTVIATSLMVVAAIMIGRARRRARDRKQGLLPLKPRPPVGGRELGQNRTDDE